MILSFFRRTTVAILLITKVYVASAGKWVAAAVIGAVVDSTSLEWDDPVEKWLPEFKGDAKGLKSFCDNCYLYLPECVPIFLNQARR